MKKHFTLSIIIVVCDVVFSTEGKSFVSNPTNEKEFSASLTSFSDDWTKMTTEELLQSCMEQPHIISLFFRRGLFQGVNRISEEHTGFAELFRRDDFASVLLGEYDKLQNQAALISETNDSLRGYLSFKYLIYEYLMAEEVFIEKLTKSQDKTIVEAIILNGFDTISRYPEVFSGIHAVPMKKLLNSGLFDNSNKAKMASLLSFFGEYESVVITTPNGTPLEEVYQLVSSDLTESEKESILSEYIYGMGISPDSIIGAPSIRYNCHAYAWHSSQEGGGVWIIGHDNIHPTNGYYLSPYWNDGSFYECSQNDDHDIVLYAGAHSARHLGNGVYESKWDYGPVIRHQLNNVRSDYLPYQPKRFFKRVLLSMSGPTIPGSPSTYSVQNLPPGWYVVWSMQGQTTLPSYFTTNYPAANQLQIDNSGKHHIKGTLVAKVYKSDGTLVKTLTKFINTSDGFTGTYSQTIPFPNQSISGQLSDGCLLDVQQGYNVTLTSTDFNGATVSYESFDTPTISSSGNTITFRFHTSTDLSFCLLHIVKGDKVIKFSLRADAALHLDPDLPLMANISGDGGSSISIELSENADSDEPLRSNAFDSWDLAIYSYTTGRVVYAGKMSGPSVSIDSSKWEPDIYVVCIKVDGKEIVQKFIIE